MTFVVTLAAVPVNGRNFEYLSGEDPYLVNIDLAMMFIVVKWALRGLFWSSQQYAGFSRRVLLQMPSTTSTTIRWGVCSSFHL